MTKPKEITVKPVYPWEKWLTKKGVRLKQGVDYFCQPWSFGVLARNAARRRGLKVAVNLLEDGVVLMKVVDQVKGK